MINDTGQATVPTSQPRSTAPQQQAERRHSGARLLAAKQHSFIRYRRSSVDRKVGVHFLSGVGKLRKLHNFHPCAFQ